MPHPSVLVLILMVPLPPAEGRVGCVGGATTLDTDVALEGFGLLEFATNVRGEPSRTAPCDPLRRIMRHPIPAHRQMQDISRSPLGPST